MTQQSDKLSKCNLCIIIIYVITNVLTVITFFTIKQDGKNMSMNVPMFACTHKQLKYILKQTKSMLCVHYTYQLLMIKINKKQVKLIYNEQTN